MTRQVRKELAGQKIPADDLDDLSCCECDATLDDQGTCPNESCCEWRGLAEEKAGHELGPAPEPSSYEELSPRSRELLDRGIEDARAGRIIRLPAGYLDSEDE